MALRKKGLKVAVTAMAIISFITSGGLNNIYADSSIDKNVTVIERTLEDKVYSVANKIEYIKDGEIITSGHGYQSLRDALSENTLIEVKNGKIYMTLEFTDSQYSIIDTIKISVDGKTTNFEKSSDRKYTVELTSLDSNIQLSYNVNVPVPNMPPHSFTVNVKLSDTPELETKNNAPVINVKDKTIYVGEEFDALSGATSGVATDNEDGDLTSKLEVVSKVDTTKPGTYEVTYKVADSEGLVTTKTIKVTVLEKEEVKPNGLENGKYKIKNTTVYSGNSSMGTSMVRNSLEEVSYLEVKDGKVYLTLEFAKDMHGMMENIKLTVDAAAVNPTINGTKYTFEVNSVSSKIGISAYITAMGMNINYSVGLEESTIEKTTSSSTSGITNGSTSGSTTSSSGTTNGSTTSTSGSISSSDTTVTESTVKKGKLYTIQNTVDHESQTGKDMARKYLNSTSKVEEIDGQYYVTLTFTGSEFMKNHVIYVNGSKVSHTVTAKSGDSISLRFKVSSLSDTIKVGTYVVPMSRDIEFTVKLLESTLKFVKEYEVSSNGSSTLPQTGSAIDGTMTMGIGTSLMALGTLLNRRKRK
ncbi:NEAT domain-containing protein [Romboutsia ilealis]|uniref:NEAT domain-containing protein n=1 Tax=Romboutsia ilealis TaxID=1115758 RepID=UPI0028A29974|nr:NEAT domain-containing protein [Romboutsia ilealis]